MNLPLKRPAALMLCFAALLSAPPSAAQSDHSQVLNVEAHLADQMAIERLVAGSYTRALDLRDWSAYADTFATDGVLEVVGRVISGRDEIEKFFRDPASMRPPREAGEAAPPPPPAGKIVTMHIVTNLLYDVQGDAATGSAYWQTVMVTDGKVVIAASGRYEDELRKVGGRWLFSKRNILTDLSPIPSPS